MKATLTLILCVKNSPDFLRMEEFVSDIFLTSWIAACTVSTEINFSNGHKNML